MQQKRILITGGAGFIGTHLTRGLLQRGYDVRVLDDLTLQVHGPLGKRPRYLPEEAELIIGDVRDGKVCQQALNGVDAVVHFAAAVGVGQSMYEIEHYTSVNDVGTAVLLQEIARKPVARLLMASSMSIYGEGQLVDPLGHVAASGPRRLEDLELGKWEVFDRLGNLLRPVPTPETKSADLTSIYALNKYCQERMGLLFGRAYGIPTVALRFFNVYGPYQSLSNPYTGVLAIFAARILSGLPPRVFEDGQQRRDFVHVHDVVRACILALENTQVQDEVFNIGSGTSRSIVEIAEMLARKLNRQDLGPEITHLYRMGDIRHCFADTRRAQEILGFRAEIDLEAGLRDYTDWLQDQHDIRILVDPESELQKRGLAF